ncbi:MAG: MarR family transcriptional regulator [Proteobacteria bacterium]|nr:MarR family transcriptional regulator [Pseudomonadota bacterium]
MNSPDHTPDGPGGGAFEGSPAWLLWRVASRWQGMRRAVLAPFGLSNAQFLVLDALARLEGTGGPASQAGLARSCGMDVTVVSQGLRALERRGLVLRRGQADARLRVPALGPAGRGLVERARPAVGAADRRFFASLGAETGRFVVAMQALAGMRPRVRVRTG